MRAKHCLGCVFRVHGIKIKNSREKKMLTFRVCRKSISLYSSREMLMRKLGNDVWLVCSSRTIQIAAPRLSLKRKMVISISDNRLWIVKCRIAQYVCQVRITRFRRGSLNQNSRHVYFKGLHNSQSSVFKRVSYLKELNLSVAGTLV